MKTINIKEKDGRITKYVIDINGVIKQLYPEQFNYDKNYVAIYNEPERVRKSKALQALRFSFVLAMATKELRSLIDIGYGNGAFLQYANANSDISLYGYDISGVKIPANVTAGFDPEWFDNKYDVMTFWDCLEHFPDLSFLRDIQAEMIVVSLPWCKYGAALLRYQNEQAAVDCFADWFHRKPNEHLHHFDRDSLLNTFAMCGWECIGTSNMEDAIRKRYHQNILTAAFVKM